MRTLQAPHGPAGFTAAPALVFRLGKEGTVSSFASGVVNTAQQVGFAVGIAAVVTIALALTDDGGSTGAQHLLAGYATGYLNTAPAALAAVLVLTLVRRRPRH